MVVMSIMAVLSVLGILAMIGINNGVIADRAAENILNQLREVQNKALSVASVSTTDINGVVTKETPVAWGVTVSKTNSGGGAQIFYIIDNGGTFISTGVSSDDDGARYTINSIVDHAVPATQLSDDAITFVYTAPFGKYFASTMREPCASGTSLCRIESQRPKSLLFNAADGTADGTTDNPANVTGKKIDIHLNFRGSPKTITVESNGEAGISE